MPTESDDRLALVLQSATDGIKQQEAGLDDLRARSSTLLAAAALSASFLGAATFGEKGLSDVATGWVVVALVGLAGVLATVLYINWPRKWDWRVNPKSMLKDYVEAAEPATLDSMRRDLALHLNDAHVANEKKLRRLWKALRIGMGSLVVEVVAFIVALAVR